jgi:diacylglycerol O-acyltransferase
MMGGDDRGREPLSGMDTALLSLETSTNLMVINGVMILAEPIAFDDLKAVVKERLLKIRRFQQRLMPSLGLLSTPVWQDDANFRIENHLHRTRLPTSKSDRSALQNLVSEMVAVPLDRSRPLWAFHLVEGYGQGCALICRIHHSIGDGVSLIQVLLSITDSEPDRACGDEGEVPLVPVPEAGLARTLLRKGRSLVGHRPRLPRLAVRSRRVASAVGQIVLAPPDPQTAFKGEIGVSKRIAWSGPIPLDRVKAIGCAMGGTVNDVLLTAASGALRRYLQGRGESADGITLHAAVPVNLRADGTEGQLGNHVGTVFAPLPVGVADPAARLRAVKCSMDRLKESYQAPVTFAAMRALGLAATPVQRMAVGILGGQATAIMTNVIGPRERRYLAGVPLDALLFWVPKTGGLALGVSILSYAGQVRLGVITDRGLVPDPEAIVAGFEAEFDELLAAARDAQAAPTLQELEAKLDEARALLEALKARDSAGKNLGGRA